MDAGTTDGDARGHVFAAHIPSPAPAAAPERDLGTARAAATLADEQVLAPVRLTRIDPSRNMKRFYTVAVEVTLFDDVACTRTYGRIGTWAAGSWSGLFETQDEAAAALGRIVSAKLARGYRCET